MSDAATSCRCVSHAPGRVRTSGDAWLFIALCACTVGGCTRSVDESPNPLTVLAAASLNDVMAEASGHFERVTHRQVVVSAGASGTLRRQIELGAPCDVFLSADPEQVNLLLSGGFLVASSVREVASNRLILAVQAGRAVPQSLTAILLDEAILRIAVPNPEYVPAGRYARQALKHAGCWHDVQTKLVLTDDVRAAERHLSLGTVDAAILYGTDVIATPQLTAAHVFAPDAHDPIRYVGAVVNRESVSPIAGEFLSFLAGDEAASMWRRHGFMSPAGSPTPQPGKSDIAESSIVDVYSAILVSIRVSLLAALFMLVPGVLLGVWLARTSSPWRHLVDIVTVTPLVVPPVVTGVLLLYVLRMIDRDLLFTGWAAAIASAIVASPLLIRTVRVAVEAVDPRFAMVAATLGATQLRTFRTITLPLAWRGVVGGLTLAWARALGEFGATIVVAGNIPGRTRTIPLAVWTASQSAPPRGVGWLIAASLLLSVAAVAVGEWMVRRHRSPRVFPRRSNP